MPRILGVDIPNDKRTVISLQLHLRDRPVSWPSSFASGPGSIPTSEPAT